MLLHESLAWFLKQGHLYDVMNLINAFQRLKIKSKPLSCNKNHIKIRNTAKWQEICWSRTQVKFSFALGHHFGVTFPPLRQMNRGSKSPWKMVPLETWECRKEIRQTIWSCHGAKNKLQYIVINKKTSQQIRLSQRPFNLHEFLLHFNHCTLKTCEFWFQKIPKENMRWKERRNGTL